MSDVPESQLKDALSEVVISIRSDLHVSRHLVGGEPRYVVRDAIRFRSHSLSVTDYRVLMALNNHKPLGDIYLQLVKEGLLTVSCEERFYSHIVNLNQRGLLSLPIADPQRLYQRFEAKRKTRRRQMMASLLCFQMPLWNPNRFLKRTAIYSRILFTRPFFLCWLMALISSLAIVFARWDDFRSSLGSILALQNVPLIVGLIVGLKAWHEFGHAFACKYFGGDVPEMGALFIVGAPCAYVDASAAWGFSNRWHRVVVNLAGMYCESMIAICAVFVWNFTTASLLNSVAHYTVLVSTVVTLAFNMNPLMRFDGYYVVSDAMNMPNLRQESMGAAHRLLKRVVLGLRDGSDSRSALKTFGLATFGVASMIYKVIVMLGICTIVAYRVPAVGLGLGALYLGHTVFAMSKKTVEYLVSHPETQPVRRRAIAVAAAMIGGLPLLSLTLPVTRTVTLAGVVGRQIEHIIRTEAPGFLRLERAQTGDHIQNGQIVASLRNPELRLQRLKTRKEVESLNAELLTALISDRSIARKIERRLATAKAEWTHLNELVNQMDVASPFGGQITQSQLERRSGMFLAAGEPLMTVSSGDWIVRAVASAEELETARTSVGEAVEVRFAQSPNVTFQARVVNVAKIGTRRMEHAELTHVGGGTIAVDTTSMRAMESYFEITLRVPQDVGEWLRHRGRAYVCFRGRPRTLANLVYTRSLQFYHRFLKG